MSDETNLLKLPRKMTYAMTWLNTMSSKLFPKKLEICGTLIQLSNLAEYRMSSDKESVNIKSYAITEDLFEIDVTYDNILYSRVTRDCLRNLPLILSNKMYLKTSNTTGHLYSIKDTIAKTCSSCWVKEDVKYIGSSKTVWGDNNELLRPNKSRKRYNKYDMDASLLSKDELEIYDDIKNYITMSNKDFGHMLDLIDCNDEKKYEKDITLILWLCGNTLERIIEFKETNYAIYMMGQQNLYTYNQVGYNFTIKNKKQDKKMIFAVKKLVNRWSNIWGRNKRLGEIISQSEYNEKAEKVKDDRKYIVTDVISLPDYNITYNVESTTKTIKSYKDYRMTKYRDVVVKDIRTVKVARKNKIRAKIQDYIEQCKTSSKLNLQSLKRLNMNFIPDLISVWKLNRNMIFCQINNIKESAVAAIGCTLNDFVDQALLFIILNNLNIDCSGIFENKKIYGYLANKIYKLKAQARYSTKHEDKISKAISKYWDEKYDKLTAGFAVEIEKLNSIVENLIVDKNKMLNIENELKYYKIWAERNNELMLQATEAWRVVTRNEFFKDYDVWSRITENFSRPDLINEYINFVRGNLSNTEFLIKELKNEKIITKELASDNKNKLELISKLERELVLKSSLLEVTASKIADEKNKNIVEELQSINNSLKLENDMLRNKKSLEDNAKIAHMAEQIKQLEEYKYSTQIALHKAEVENLRSSQVDLKLKTYYPLFAIKAVLGKVDIGNVEIPSFKTKYINFSMKTVDIFLNKEGPPIEDKELMYIWKLKMELK
jgi:hypothetical protein